MTLQETFNKVSADCADLNAKLTAKLQDDNAKPEEFQKIKDDLTAKRARRDALNEQIKALSDEKDNPSIPVPGLNAAGTNLTPKNVTTDKLKESFHTFLKSEKVTTDLTGVGLSDGSILVPETILPAEHEEHQFPRLGTLVRNVAVSTTTGKLPVFQDSGDKLTVHTEFTETTPNQKPDIKPVPWDLNTYTGRYVFSQDLISDSTYDWEGEFQNSLIELRDNTDDDLIATQLTKGITATAATDLITEIKSALNKGLKPLDSANASIVLSQSAFDELDNLKDTTGRPIVQPNVTLSTGNGILGRPVIVLDDLLFPGAALGDANVIVTPLQKAVIKFKNNEITGQFQDTHDIWYKSLGIYLREDVVQARADLINFISSKVPSGSKTA